LISPWRVLALALGAQVGISVIDQGIPTLAGFLKRDLELSAGGAGLLVSAYYFGKILGSYAAGIAADRLGERRVLVLGGAVAAAFVALAAAAGPVSLLFVLLLLAGVAGAAGTPAGGRLVLVAFPAERRGLALGIRQTGIPLGGIIAAGALPPIAATAGWRWSLVAAAGLAILGLLPLALTRIDRVTEPLLENVERPRGQQRNVYLLTLWACLIVSGQYALLVFLVLDLHETASLSLTTGALLLAIANATGIVGRIAWGAASDRALANGRKPLLLLLTAVGLGGVLLLLLVPRDAPLAVLAVMASIAGLSLIGYQGLWITMLAESAGTRQVGAATGFAITFVTISMALSPPLYGLIADAAGTYRAVWAALAVVVALAFIPAALVRESPRRADEVELGGLEPPTS
jgi:MFS family permease